MDGAEVASIEGLLSLYDTSNSDFNQEQVQEELDIKEKQPKTPGSVGLGTMQIKGPPEREVKYQVEKIASNLYETFDKNFKKNFIISPAIKPNDYGVFDFPYENKMKITNKNTGEEKIYSIGADATQEVVDEINKDFADYITVDSSYQDSE